MKYVVAFTDSECTHLPLSGGKNASLARLIQQFTDHNLIKVPLGFAVTTQAYWYFLHTNELLPILKELMNTIGDGSDHLLLSEYSSLIRQHIIDAYMPLEIKAEIARAYTDLSAHYKESACDVAVRSSATAEDLEHASFAGQQETYLHISGIESLILHIKKCIASLFTERAIIYRIHNNIDHFSVAMSVGIQKMVRSDMAISGVMFTLDPESGFPGIITVNASYGLGESLVQGSVNPDEFHLHKATLRNGYKPIIKKDLGSKKTKLCYADKELISTTVNICDQKRFCISDEELLHLARIACALEDHYAAHTHSHDNSIGLDIEWAKDGVDGHFYITQVRPETIHRNSSHTTIRYQLEEKPSEIILSGVSVGQAIATGTVRIITSTEEKKLVQPGDILVTHMTDPDWLPIMKKAAAIITDIGGRTCHAAIVARELGIPALVGTIHATSILQTGMAITIDCSTGSRGYVYQGTIPFTTRIENQESYTPQVPILLNIADPDRAYSLASLPVSGVGLARLEFIINTEIKVHPLAVIFPERVADIQTKECIKELSIGYDAAEDFYVHTLAQGIARIAAAFYPRPVVIRLSDFKTNEYRNLLGGIFFEPLEENPMLGLRGAARYCHPTYEKAFELECAALAKARNEMGLKNIKIMVPFVRTIDEADRTIHALKKNGFERGVDDLSLIMMCEIPANVILLEQFATYFDGFSIGSNDLTQLTLGVDRDSGLLSELFDERNEAVKQFIALAIEKAKKLKRPISICGQAPSDYPEIADFLIEQGISAISVNPDSVLSILSRLAQ